MDIHTIINKAKSAAYLTGHFCYKHRAKIAFVGGGVAIAVGTKMIMNNAEEISKVNKIVKEDRELCKKMSKEKTFKGQENEEVDEGKMHYICRTGINHIWSYTKTAGPGIAVIGIGYGLCGYALKTTDDDLKSMTIQAAMTANLLANYRKRVIADVGEEKDYEYLTGKKIVAVTTDENGVKTTVETTVERDDNPDHNHIPHSFFFDECHPCFTKSNVVNKDTLMDFLDRINFDLETKRFLTENDMRDICHAPRTIIGNTAGARFKNPDGTTNRIVFNRYAMERFLEGTYEPSCLCVFEYDNGRPIEDNIMMDIDWESGL